MVPALGSTSHARMNMSKYRGSLKHKNRPALGRKGTLCPEWTHNVTGVGFNTDTFAHNWKGPVAELVGIEVGVVSGVMTLESSGVEAPDWRPRHGQVYHDA